MNVFHQLLNKKLTNRQKLLLLQIKADKQVRLSIEEKEEKAMGMIIAACFLKEKE